MTAETQNSHGWPPAPDRMAVPGGMGSPALEDSMGIDDIVDKAKGFVGDAVDNSKDFAGGVADKVKDVTHGIAAKIADATDDEEPSAPAAITTPAP